MNQDSEELGATIIEHCFRCFADETSREFRPPKTLLEEKAYSELIDVYDRDGPEAKGQLAHGRAEAPAPAEQEPAAPAARENGASARGGAAKAFAPASGGAAGATGVSSRRGPRGSQGEPIAASGPPRVSAEAAWQSYRGLAGQGPRGRRFCFSRT